MLRNGIGVPGMGISEVEKGGKKYSSFCGGPLGGASLGQRNWVGDNLKEKIISNVCLRSYVSVFVYVCL